jgi:hypothetical protein
LLTSLSSLLLSNTSSTTLTGSLVLGTVGISLVLDGLGSELLSLSLVDVLHQDTLVLEDVTLRLEVQGVIQVLVDLTGFSVLAEKTTEDTHTAHPQDLTRHTSIGSTLALTVAHVATSTLSSGVLTNAEARVADLGLADDKTVLDELANVLARVGIGDLIGFVGVEPNLSLTTLENAGSKFLLASKVNPKVEECKKKIVSCNLISDHQAHIVDDDISTHRLPGTARPPDTRLDSYKEFSSGGISDHYISISITLRILFEELESDERNSWARSSGQKTRGASGVIEVEIRDFHIHTWLI